MANTYSYTMQLTIIECCVCHMDFGMTPEFERARRRDHKMWYCPAGHPQYFSARSDVERLRDDLEATQRQLTQARSRAEEIRQERDRIERRRRATKAALTKTKQRIASGKCIRCAQTFPDLAAHMETEHPGAEV
jgi:hypothetical protein